MKAKEYLARFTIESIKDDNALEINKIMVKCIFDMFQEISDRNCKSNNQLAGVIKEIITKADSLALSVNKKYGVEIFETGIYLRCLEKINPDLHTETVKLLDYTYGGYNDFKTKRL